MHPWPTCMYCSTFFSFCISLFLGRNMSILYTRPAYTTTGHKIGLECVVICTPSLEYITSFQHESWWIILITFYRGACVRCCPFFLLKLLFFQQVPPSVLFPPLSSSICCCQHGCQFEARIYRTFTTDTISDPTRNRPTGSARMVVLYLIKTITLIL